MFKLYKYTILYVYNKVMCQPQHSYSININDYTYSTTLGLYNKYLINNKKTIINNCIKKISIFQVFVKYFINQTLLVLLYLDYKSLYKSL